MVMDYVLNPIICTILCTQLTRGLSSLAGPIRRHRLLRGLFTALNLRGIKASARTNEVIGIGLGAVVLLFLGACASLPASARPSTRPLSRGPSTTPRRSPGASC